MIPSFPFEARLLLIPLISGIIGYVTNWVGIKLLFYPVRFVGVRVPGLKRLALYLPYKLQQIPGVLEGRIGWQGIIPSRVRKMASLSVDNGISNLASQREFYEQFDPDRIADHVVDSVRHEVDDLVDRIVREEHPRLWRDLPEPILDLIHGRVASRLPGVADRLTQRIGENIDELLDLKTMVIRHKERNPEIINRMFLEVGRRELRFVINSGLWIGGTLGIFVIPLFLYVDRWWILPVSGACLGYVTNWIALKLIFNPIEERKIGPFRLQGLFISRQDEVSEVYAEIVANEVVTLSNIAEDLLHGRKSDRTRQMIREALREEVDDALGLAEPAVRITAGNAEYEAIRESLATEAVDRAIEPMRDEAFNRERAAAIEDLIAERLRELPPGEYAQMLRAAFEEDEWMLIALGAALGFVAGWIQLMVVTAL